MRSIRVSFSHNPGAPFLKALLPAFITAVMVTSYSIVDGIGVRVSKAPLSYIAWLFTAEVCVAVFILLPRLSLLKSQGLRPNLIGFSGGIISSLSYGLALFAKTLAPLALVAAVRETSVILATILAFFGFRATNSKSSCRSYYCCTRSGANRIVIKGHNSVTYFLQTLLNNLKGMK